MWNRDLDRFLTFRDLTKLADHLGINPDAGRATSLRPHAARLKGLGSGLTPGILRLGVFHRTRRLHGQQYCPECLAEDPQPYFRREWRLAFVFACRRHRRPLRDGCPHCDTPVVFHRSPALEFSRCHVCGGNLLIPNAAAPVGTISCQDKLLVWWDRGSVPLGDRQISFVSWLAGARVLFHALQAIVPDEFQRSVPLEIARVELRARLLSAAMWLTEVWPARLRRALSLAGLPASAVMDVRRSPAPRWLAATICETLDYRPRSRRQSGEVMAANRAEPIDLADLISIRLDGIPAAGARR